MPRKRDKKLGRYIDNVDKLDPQGISGLVHLLDRKRSLLGTVLDSIREGVLVIDCYGTLLYCNSVAPGMLGLASGMEQKGTLWNILPELAQSLPLGIDASLRLAASVTREVEVMYPEHRYLRINITPLGAEEGTLHQSPRFTVVLHDISAEVVQTQQRVEEGRIDALTDLVAAVAHEIGNPLNSVNIHLGIIRKNATKLPDSAQSRRIHESSEVCIQEAMRLEDILKNFLVSTRPSQTGMVDINLQQVTEDVLHTTGPMLAQSGIDVCIIANTDIPLVKADPDQVKQVLVNIIKNAREAMDQGGKLHISLDAGDEFLNLRIGDTGHGMTEEELARVFMPYYTTKKTGSGLGMMIVQRIMRAHGGRIGIDSRKGIGTVVTLQFPLANRRIRLLKG